MEPSNLPVFNNIGHTGKTAAPQAAIPGNALGCKPRPPGGLEESNGETKSLPRW
jgi:hypothetical protein